MNYIIEILVTIIIDIIMITIIIKISLNWLILSIPHCLTTKLCHAAEVYSFHINTCTYGASAYISSLELQYSNA